MACPDCQNGWITVQRLHRLGPDWAEVDGDGWRMLRPLIPYSGVERCPCSIPAKASVLRPTPKKIADVVEALSRLIPFFPSDGISLKLVTAEVHKFCDDADKLERWAHEAMLYFTKWQGVGPLRALYCSMYRPADGVYATASFQDAEGRTQIGLPGYTEPELLARGMADEKAMRLQIEEQFSRRAITEGFEPFLLPEVKRIA